MNVGQHQQEICGVSSAASRDVFIEVEGLNTIKAFGALSGDTDVTKIAKRMASRIILGTMQIKRIQALVFWVKDHERRQMDIVSDAGMRRNNSVQPLLGRKRTRTSKNSILLDIVDPGKSQTDFGWDLADRV